MIEEIKQKGGMMMLGDLTSEQAWRFVQWLCQLQSELNILAECEDIASGRWQETKYMKQCTE